MNELQIALNPVDWSGVDAIVSILILIFNVFLLLTVIVGYKTIREEVKNRDSTLLLWAMDEISKIKEDIYNLKDYGDYCSGDFDSDKFKILWSEDKCTSAQKISISLQRLSYMAMEGLISKEHFSKMWGPTFISSWECLEKYIHHKRFLNGEPEYLKDGAFSRKDFERYTQHCKKEFPMTTKQLARKWLEENHPSINENFRCSKYDPKKDIWVFDFPIDYFDSSKNGNLIILLQHKDGGGFILLEVPYSYLRDQRSKFDVRSSGDRFDLHISAKKRNWLECERNNGVSFARYENNSNKTIKNDP